MIERNMINLNSDNFKEREYAAIFNGGTAGLVENVTIKVTKKTAVDPDNLPDYKLIVTDSNGAEVNEGFYYADEGDERKGNLLVQRLAHVARAVLGKGYEFPEYPDLKAAADGLLALIAKNCDGKAFRVYVTYGNVGYPSKYLKLRYFDFIESMEVPVGQSRLRKKNNDLLVRITEDAPMTGGQTGGTPSDVFGTAPTTSTSDDDDWLS